MLSVLEVKTKADLKRFIDYPYQLYKGHLQWVPPLRMGEWERFNPEKNPFYEHGTMTLFLAERSGDIVGRIAGIDDEIYRQTHDENIGFFGFFEAADAEAAEVLFDRVRAWAVQQGRRALRGPVNPTMNDGSGFQIDAFDTPPFIMMPYSPPAYPGYAEAAGFEKVKDLYAWMFRVSHDMGETIRRLTERVKKRHDFSVRPLSMKSFHEEVARLLAFYNEVWEANWGQTKYTAREAEHLANELKLIVDPDIVLFLEIEGELAGIGVCFPNANQLFKKMKGRLFPFGIFHALRAKHIIDEARLPILGVKETHRNKGFELVLINEIFKRGAAKGYKRAELSWILEDNDAMNKAIAASGADLYKTYRLYQQDL